MTTLDLFTREFTMPDGTTRPPLVERVPEIDPPREIHDLPKNDEHRELRLILAAHEWAGYKWRGASYGDDCAECLQDHGLCFNPHALVLACHLIADSLAAKGNA